MNKEKMMKDKIFGFYEKHKIDLFIIITALFYTSYVILTRDLNNLDEIWVFNTARNIANGLLPYKDFNLVTTPGIPIICGIILKIFGTELLCMRILAILLCSAIIYMIYKCLNALEINDRLSIIAVFGITYLFKNYYCIDYNFATLLIALICMYNEIKYIKNHEFYEYDFKYNFLLGILAGSTILMKQTSGFVFSAIFVGYKILKVLDKEGLKKFFKIAIVRIAGVMVPVVVLLAYILINNIFNDFINYAILGITEFDNSIAYTELLKGDFKILAVVLPIILIITMIKNIVSEDRKVLILTGYSIPLLILIYPIADEIHFIVATTIIMIAGIFWLQQIINKIPIDKLSRNKQVWIIAFIESVGIIIGAFYIIISAFGIFKVDFSNYILLKNFKYIPISYDLESSIISVDNYINNLNDGNTVYIVDARAPVYMIPLDRYNKDYDMLLIGNIGKNGTEKLCDEVFYRDDLTLLIVNDNVGLNWQTPVKVIDTIKQYYQKVDSISLFDVYVKK